MTITFQTVNGLEVARFTTDAAGKFRVSLEPGRYVMRALTARRMTVLPELPDNQVVVAADQFTVLKLVFDSGRR